MKDDSSVVADHDDAEMMKRPHLWPHLLLPLKRRKSDGGFPETGYIGDPGPPGIVVLGTIWGGPEGGTLEYATPEEAVADGWVVD